MIDRNPNRTRRYDDDSRHGTHETRRQNAQYGEEGDDWGGRVDYNYWDNRRLRLPENLSEGRVVYSHGRGQSVYNEPDVWSAPERRDPELMRGVHIGHGPKGYRRADSRIYEDVCETLTDDRFLDARNIEVQVDEGRVTLSGSVEDRTAKRRAERIIENISGVVDVSNQLKIVESSAPNPAGGSSPK